MATLSLEVGENVLARIDEAKSWNLGSVTSIDLDAKEVTLKWINDDRIVTVPLNPSFVEVLGKRSRKPRVNLIELEYELDMATEKRRRGPKLLTDETPQKKTSESKPSKKSANVLDIEEVERTSDASLASFLPVLAPFITPKTHARLSATSPVTPGSPPLLSQPKSIVNVTMRDYQREGLSWIAHH